MKAHISQLPETIKSIGRTALKVITKCPALPGFLFLALLLCIFYQKILFFNAHQLHPAALATATYVSFTAEGESQSTYPTWNPYLNCGTPFFDTASAGRTLNPIDFTIKQLFEDMSLPDFTFFIGNCLLFALFIYLLLRSWNAKIIVCLFASITVVFIPQFVTFIAYGKGPHFLSLVPIPLILYFLNRTLERRSPIMMALLALTAGFQIVRGDIEVVYCTFILIALFSMFKCTLIIREKNGGVHAAQSGLLLLGAIVLAIALASHLLLPLLDYHLHAATAGDYKEWITSFASYSPLQLITLFVPSFFGFDSQTYWGPPLHHSLYFGTLPLFLASLALVTRRDRHTLFLAAVAFITLLMSCAGSMPPLLAAMRAFLPLFAIVREPANASAIFNIAVVLLAALGFESLIDLRKSPRTHLQRIRLFIIVIITVYSAAFAYLLLSRNSYFLKIIASGQTMTAETRNFTYLRALLDAFFTTLLCSGVGVMVLLYIRKRVGALLCTATIVVLTIADLWVVDFNILKPQSAADEANYFAKSEAVAHIQGDPEIFRIYPIIKADNPDWYMYHKLCNIRGRSDYRVESFASFTEQIGFDTRVFNNTPPLFNKFWRIVIREGRAVFRPVPPMFVSPAQIASDRAVLDMLNVKYVITNSELQDDHYEKIIDSSPKAYLNSNYLPRAFFADSLVECADRDSILDFIRSGDFNPRDVAIVEERPPFSIYPADSNHVRLIGFRANSVTMEAAVVTPTILVLSELYYPQGWKAFVDGVETKIYRTNYLLRAIFLTPGTHMVHFAYSHKVFKTAQYISMASLGIIIGIVITVPMLTLVRRKVATGQTPAL